jgi:hypothetical protein
VILTAAIVGASLFYGDAVITPAISVLSAVEGLKVLAPQLKPLWPLVKRQKQLKRVVPQARSKPVARMLGWTPTPKLSVINQAVNPGKRRTRFHVKRRRAVS